MKISLTAVRETRARMHGQACGDRAAHPMHTCQEERCDQLRVAEKTMKYEILVWKLAPLQTMNSRNGCHWIDPLFETYICEFRNV
jgi:hypothetical protein